MTQSDIKHVFEEFYQVDGSDVYDERGSGLGLTLSRELIRLHGGVMNVSSAGVPGQGSRFSFTLPTTQNLVAQMPTSNQPSEREQGENAFLSLTLTRPVTDFFAALSKVSSGRYLQRRTRSHAHNACV